jgi:rhamnosyltransferase
VLSTLRGQCLVTVVDNTPLAQRTVELPRLVQRLGADFLPLGENKGIGCAQNRGVELLMARSVEFILLMDQDSIPEEKMVQKLLADYAKLADQGSNVAAVTAMAIEASGIMVDHSYEPAVGGLARTKYMTSSGSLIPMSAWKRVGKMNEEYFIDLVDFDWGWRAIAERHCLFVSKNACLQHRLGEGVIRRAGFSLFIPSPIRHYYQYRNISLALKRRDVPWPWKLEMVAKLLVKPLIVLFAAPEPILRLRYMLHGLRDAFRRQLGPYQYRRTYF